MRAENLTGRVFGRLTVLARAGSTERAPRRPLWRCRCACFLAALAKLCRTSVAWLLGDAPQIPESTQRLLRDAKLDPRDRETLLEVAGIWSTPEEGAGPRGGRP